MLTALNALNHQEKATLKIIGKGFEKLSELNRKIGPINSNRVFIRLLNLGLVERYFEGGDAVYTSTRAGLSVIAEMDRIEREKQNIAPPRNFDFINERYVPPKQGYIRNAGNKHILSKGF